jgi:hypothetical protein
MVETPDQKLAIDTQLLEIYLTGLQSEVEAKLRRVNRFREQMKKIDSAGGKTDKASRVQAAQVLLKQIGEMLQTNLEVRETLKELQKAAEAVLKDVEEL